MVQWIQGTVVDNIHWTENLYSLKIDADVDTFIAGQFTSLALEIDGERIDRPYSFLSAPGQNPLEFFFYTATKRRPLERHVRAAGRRPHLVEEEANWILYPSDNTRLKGSMAVRNRNRNRTLLLYT